MRDALDGRLPADADPAFGVYRGFARKTASVNVVIDIEETGRKSYEIAGQYEIWYLPSTVAQNAVSDREAFE